MFEHGAVRPPDPTVAPVRCAVFASGGGSNLESLLQYAKTYESHARYEVVLVVSNRDDAGALRRAARHNVAHATITNDANPDALLELLHVHSVALIALAGYLRLVPPAVVQQYSGAILNIHPALLPSFGGKGMYGARVHRAVLSAGVRVSGATVHLVDSEYDRGAILAQWPVQVLHGDTAEELAARVLRVEHILYPRALHAVASGSLTAERPLLLTAAAAESTALETAAMNDAKLAACVDRALGLSS